MNHIPSGCVICDLFTAVWRTFTGHLSVYFNVFHVLCLTNRRTSGFPHHATGLPDVELAIGCLQHLFQMPCELWERQRNLMQVPPGISHIVIINSLETYICT